MGSRSFLLGFIALVTTCSGIAATSITIYCGLCNITSNALLGVAATSGDGCFIILVGVADVVVVGGSIVAVASTGDGGFLLSITCAIPRLRFTQLFFFAAAPANELLRCFRRSFITTFRVVVSLLLLR